MFARNVPMTFLGDIILTKTYLINCMPSKALDFKTPIETLKNYFSHIPWLGTLSSKVFGCTVFVHIPSKGRSKLDPRATKCIFLGYSPTQKSYKCFHPPSRKKFVTMDVNFFEDQPYYQKTNLQEEKLEMEDHSQDWSLHLPMPT